MATKFEVVLSASLDKNSVSDIQKQINEISKGAKFNIQADNSQINSLTKSIQSLGNEASNAKEHTQGLGDIVSKFSSWQIVGDVIHGVKDAMTDMVQQVFDLDESLTELDKVTDLTSSGLQSLADDAFDVGQQIGATGKSVIDATTIFAQAGYAAQDALDLGEQAVMLTNVSEAGATAENSASTLIATMKAFGLEASDASHVVDALNEVSNKYAVSVNDLSTAIQKSSASMATGNNTLEQTFGLVTAGTEILQEPGRVANGLSTITARLTADNDEYIKSITGGMGVIDEQTGELRSTYDILQDLSEAWEGLTSVEQQELAETVAGKTQRSLFTAIMTNFESAVGATQAALESEGSATTENEKRMDSLQGKVQQLQSAWQDFARNTIDGEVVKSILSLGTNILNFANSDLGRFITVLATATAAVIAFKKVLTVENLLKFAGSFTSLTKAVAAGTTAFQLTSSTAGIFKSSMVAASAGVEVLTKSLLASPLFGVIAGGMAIYGIITAVNTLIPRMEDLSAATDESTQAYEEAKQKTKEVENELENINTQITALEKKDKLSFTDEEELQKLKSQREELENSLAIAQKLEEVKKNAAAQDIQEELDYKSQNPFDYWNIDEAEQSIEDAKKILKDAGNEVAESLGNDRENIRLETQDMMAAYKELAEEIAEQKEKMAESETISEEDQEALEEMEEVYGNLGGYLAENAEKFQDWSDTLEGGGEQAEETRGELEDLLSQIYDTIDATDENTSANENNSDSASQAAEAQAQLKESLTYTEEELENLNGEIDEIQSSYGILATAVDEYNSTGGITLDTLQQLLSLNGEYLSALQLVDGNLQISSQAQQDHANKLQQDTLALIENASMQDLQAMAEEAAGNVASVAGSKIYGAGQDAKTAGDYAAQGANGFLALADAMSQAGMVDLTNVNTQDWANKWAGITTTITNLTKNSKLSSSSYVGTSSGGSSRKSSGSSSKKSSSGSKGSSASKTSSADTYKAEVDALYWYKNALDNAEESVDKLNDALKDTDNFNEQEKYLNQLIDATNNQINKTNELKNAQVGQINDFINQLRAQGFAIDYNSSKNELYINNMQHLSDFTGDTAKNLEKLIDKVQDLNDDNRDLDGSVRDLTSDIKDYYDQLAEIPEEKLEKFNDLMEDFQQSRLDQVQNQIDDLEHEMENDPRIKALEKQIDALEKQNDELDKQEEIEEKILAVEEAKIKLQNAQNQKTVQVYREGQGWVWEADIDEIEDAQEDLADAQKDLNEQVKEDQIEQLEEQKEAIEQSYQDRIDALEDFLDEQEYLIDKANRTGIQSFEELRNELEKYGLDSEEYLGKATEWLNNYNAALAELNTTMDGLLGSGVSNDGLIYSSEIQNRIDQALSSVIPDTTTTGLSNNNMNYDSLGDKGTNQTIYISNIE